MRLQVGYVPLTDAAPVIAAAHRGFAEAEGIAIELSPEPSWATLRDRLALDHLDAAHMLAPLALASALGLSGPRADLVVPLALNRNGNAITLSTALWAEMAPLSDDLDDVAAAFARAARDRARTGRPLTLGTVHPFSCHSYQLRLFAERGGLDPASLALVVVPPPQTVDALERGIIDGFCVGAPWNSIAVASGIGRIAALGCEVAPDCPEKVLAVHCSQATALLPLVRAVHRAGLWCAEPANRADLTALLIEKGGLGQDRELIERTLSGQILTDPEGRLRARPDYLRFGLDVQRPRPEDALWLAARMRDSGEGGGIDDLGSACAAIYRPDLFAAI